MINRELFIPGVVGNLEAILQESQPQSVARVMIICHPHPLFHGTMQNKVVTTVARACNTLGITAVRFNFRGVGKSDGSFGDITGEVEDALAVLNWVQTNYPQAKLYFAGFSFGSYVAAAVASQSNPEWLLTIAPPVERMPYDKLPEIKCPWLTIQGEEDEIVTPQAVYDWFNGLKANKTLVKMPDTKHFFHGKLVELQQIIEQYCPL